MTPLGNVDSTRAAIQTRAWLRWLPVAGILIAAAILLLNWQSLPERWVVHWGRGGQPNGWATKTPLMVFLPLIVGAFISAFIEILATIIVNKPRIRSGI